MIKLFVKMYPDGEKRTGLLLTELSGQTSKTEFTGNTIFKDFQFGNKVVYNKFCRPSFHSSWKMKPPLIQPRKKGFDQKMIKYLLEPDDIILKV